MSRVMLWLFVIDVIWLLVLVVMVVSRLYAKHLGAQSRGWVKQGTLGRAKDFPILWIGGETLGCFEQVK